MDADQEDPLKEEMRTLHRAIWRASVQTGSMVVRRRLNSDEWRRVTTLARDEHVQCMAGGSLEKPILYIRSLNGERLLRISYQQIPQQVIGNSTSVRIARKIFREISATEDPSK